MDNNTKMFPQRIVYQYRQRAVWRTRWREWRDTPPGGGGDSHIGEGARRKFLEEPGREREEVPKSRWWTWHKFYYTPILKQHIISCQMFSAQHPKSFRFERFEFEHPERYLNLFCLPLKNKASTPHPHPYPQGEMQYSHGQSWQRYFNHGEIRLKMLNTRTVAG